MLMKDGFDLPLSTGSPAARDAYVIAVDKFLGADGGVAEAFQTAIDADDGLALAYIGLARQAQLMGRSGEVKGPLEKARALAGGLSERERSHINAQGLLLEGKSAAAFEAVNEHLKHWPRDALVAQPCTGVFGLIAFSGRPARKAEQLAFSTALEPFAGGDWWFQAQHAFAQGELGLISEAEKTIDRAIMGNPHSGHTAHIRAHIYYEAGEADEGLEYLDSWRQDYATDGALYLHVAWHVALWALAAGDEARMWQLNRDIITPGALEAPPLNILTDASALLFRAELAGATLPNEQWRAVSEFAKTRYPKPGLAFADVHAALAHAMAGDSEALSIIVGGAKGLAGELVRELALAFGAMAAEDWQTAVGHLRRSIYDNARIGGSNAQRDLIEFALASALLKLGRGDEARALVTMHRPLSPGNAVHGLQV